MRYENFPAFSSSPLADFFYWQILLQEIDFVDFLSKPC